MISRTATFNICPQMIDNQTNGFNAAIGIERYAPGPQVLNKMWQKSGSQTKPAYFWTFWPISRDPVHIFYTDFWVETVSSGQSF